MLEVYHNTMNVKTIKFPNEVNCLMKGHEILIRFYHVGKDMNLSYIKR
jgi:hypothetical protein